MSKECYAVDLDGTLAEYTGWQGNEFIGKAIPSMISMIKQWIQDGIEVIIFTARATDPKNIPAIEKWLERNDLPKLKITNIKTPDIARIYDDRAVQVRKNTGELLGDQDIIGERLVSKLYEMYFNN